MNAADRLELSDVVSEALQEISVQSRSLLAVEDRAVDEIITGLVPELDAH
ncbi:MAG: hypothetical protein ACKOEM_20110 [Planctomycetia bacterium]